MRQEGQEDFLGLRGKGVLTIEGQERPLRVPDAQTSAPVHYATFGQPRPGPAPEP